MKAPPSFRQLLCLDRHARKDEGRRVHYGPGDEHSRNLGADDGARDQFPWYVDRSMDGWLGPAPGEHAQ